MQSIYRKKVRGVSMTDDQTQGELHKDFFISYSHADHRWAEWIAWQLEEAGYSTILQAWDFQTGGISCWI
jgi:TIR domain